MILKEEVIICDSGNDNVGQILSKKTIKQVVNLDKNGLIGISLRFGTYKRRNSSKVKIVIHDFLNEKINYETIIEGPSLDDGFWKGIQFPENIFKKTKRIVILVSSLEAKINDCVTLFYNAYEKDKYFTIWDRKINGSLNLKLTFKKQYEEKENNKIEILNKNLILKIDPKKIKSKEKLTICCLTYNHEKYIQECLVGFLKQKTNFNFKIKIIDDASTDSTTDIIKNFCNLYPDFFEVTFKNYNTSPEESFLDLLKNIKTEYVALCEGDDFWTCENKLQKQFDFLEENKNYSACFHPVRVEFENDSKKNYIFPNLNKNFVTLNELSENNCIQTNSVFYRWRFLKEDIQKLLPIDSLPGDWYLHLLHAEKGNIGYINEVMGVYRKHDGGIWSGGVDKVVKNYGIQHANFFKNLKNHFYPKYAESFQNRYDFLIKKNKELNKKIKKISVIIPTYNQHLYIQHAVESVLKQKGNFEIEIIIGNDNSTDKTFKILDNYKNLNNVKILNNLSNLGLLENLLNCLKECSGDYVAICEGDDYWTSPWRLHRFLNYMENNKDVAASFNHVVLFEENKGYYAHPEQSKLKDKIILNEEDLLKCNYPGNLSSCFYKKDILDKVLKNIDNASDWIINTAAASLGGMAFLKEKSSIWRIHSKGMWNKYSNFEKIQKIEELKKKLKDILENFKRKNIL